MAKTIHEEEYRLIDKVTAGFANIAVGLKGLSRSFTELNQAAELAGKGINFVKTAAAGIGSAVQGAADYEEAMRRVSIITQATAEEQVQLQEAVRLAAGTVGATADEASAALLTMARDGFSAREAIDNLGTVLAYAKVQATGAAEAAQGLGGILDSFGARASLSVGQVADALTATAVAAGTTSDTLEKGLAGIGVAAQESNLSFEQTIALLGVLAQRNIEGGDAAKRLATILDQFRDPASQAGKALKDLGLSGADVSTILERLSTDSAAASKVLEGFGKKPRDALNVLLTDGGGALKALTAIINENKGATEQAATALEGTFNDAIDRAAAQLSVLQNVAAGPILTPLADGIALLAKRLGDFANSPEFAKLTQQFAAFVKGATEEIAAFIAETDFESVTASISKFVNESSQLFEALGVVVKATAVSIRGIGAAIQFVVDNVDVLEAAMGVSVSNVSRLRLASVDLEASLRRAGAGADKGGKSTKEFGAEAYKAADAAWELAPAVTEVGAAATDAAGGLDAAADSAGPAANALGGVGQAARDTAIAFERMQVGVLLRAMDALMVAGLQTSDSYKALNTKFLEAEARINALTKANQEAAASTGDVAAAADNASRAVSNYGSSAGNAASKSDDVSSSAADATEALSNFEEQAKSVSFSLGNMSEAFAKQAQAAAGTAQSATEYVDIWNSYVEKFEDVNRAVERHIEVLQRQTGALTEEDKIRRLLQAQYGNESSRLEELVQLKLKLAEARRKDNDESEREIQIEERRTQLAGGIGTQGAPTEAAPGVSAGRGTSAGAGSRDAAGQTVNVTINGLPSDRASWRDVIAEIIVPEINRINRLSR